jgi:GT2 family glycosyltransferase
VRASVVIPVHNGAAFLHACLEALLAQEGADFTVLAVENGSTDDSADLIARTFPQVRLLRHAEQLGFARAVNTGIRAALADPEPPEAIVLLNQDTRVDPGWLAALLRPLAADARIGIVGSLARFPDGRIQHAGGELLMPLGYGRNIAYGASALPPESPTPDYISALAVALRTEMLRAIGLFDEAFFSYFEDADLCLRARAADWKLAVALDATLVHHEGAASAVSYSHAALIERNRLRLAAKHRPVDELLGAFLEAERKHLLARAQEGSSQVLRQAYLHTMLALPTIAAGRALPATAQTALAAALADLRTTATALERTSRMGGLQLPTRNGPRPHGHPTRGPSAPAAAPARARPPFTTGARPPVSIVILTWNGLEFTRACLESLRAKTCDVEYHLVVVDNGSTDGTREWLRAQNDITLIENETNVGFTRGNNQGMAIVPPDHDVLLLNNDTLIIQENWLARLREVANDHPDYGIVGCKLLHPNGALQHAGTYMPVGTFWGYQIGGYEANIGQYPGVREVEGVVGACMYIRRDVRATIGGLDEDYFSYFEDTDYCLRAALHGYKIVCVGDVYVVHRENTSAKLNNANWSAMFSRSQAIFRTKWADYYASQRYTRKLLWHSLVSSATGYSTSSRQFVIELDRRGVDVRLACIWGIDTTEPPTGDPRVDQLRQRPKDTSLVQVVYHQGDSFIKNSGRYRIGFTMMETTGIPEDWVNQANQMDEVWVPSHFNQQTFRDSGVRRPIYVIPLGVDPNYFHPAIAARKPGDRFVFLSVFEWLERKAPEVLLRAYTEEFSRADDVVLVLKVYNHDQRVNVQQQVAALRLKQNAPPIAILLNQDIAAHQMGSLYRSADCFVLPTRGEGWGMPILEAMACGLPVIATDWSAQTEFFHAGVGYPLRIKGLVPALTKKAYYAGFRWADPDLEHLRYLMRYVYEHSDEARAVGQRAALEAASRWTWSHAVDRILERLQEIEG